MAGSKALPNIIFLSLENWDDIWRRNQFLCAAYSQRYPDAKILFVGLARDFSNRLRLGRLGDLRRGADSPPGLPNITITQPIKLLPNSLSWGRAINEAMFRAHVRREARRLGLSAPLLWLNPHSAVHMVGRMGESGVVYDITDDWIEAATSPAERQLIEAQDTELCRRANAVIVCSQRLYDQKRPLARNLHLIPNGVDGAHYSRVLDRSALHPRAAADWRRPVFGYTGTLHSERVDIELIEALARAFPQGTVALVGPNYLPAECSARLQRLSNIKLTGPVAYQDLPDYMRVFDVCITPHRMTAFTESLNPIKLWEYLAGGKPIVSTDVAGFRDYPQFVRLASDAPSFIAACCDALSDDLANGALRQAEAEKHSWNDRLESVLAVLRDLEENRA